MPKDEEMDVDKLPKKLETMDDYQKACLGFVLPFLHSRASRIAEVIRALHTAIDEGDMEQEEIDGYINEVKQLTGFAATDNPMNLYFNNVIALEKKLDEAGEFSQEAEE